MIRSPPLAEVGGTAEPGGPAAEDGATSGAVLVVPMARLAAALDPATTADDVPLEAAWDGAGVDRDGGDRDGAGELAGGCTARTWPGVNDGWVPAPNVQASTLPGPGC